MPLSEAWSFGEFGVQTVVHLAVRRVGPEGALDGDQSPKLVGINFSQRHPGEQAGAPQARVHGLGDAFDRATHHVGVHLAPRGRDAAPPPTIRSGASLRFANRSTDSSSQRLLYTIPSSTARTSSALVVCSCRL